MRFDLVVLEQILKVVQILFYVVGSTIAILTYLKAKDTLLNSVNTEYQKKVIGRLEELAKELSSEFDSNSPNYWALHNPVIEFVNEINKFYMTQKEELQIEEYYPYGYPVNARDSRIRYLLNSIKSDPFIPKQIREIVIESLERRISSTFEIYCDAFDSYYESLRKSEKMLHTDGTDPEFDKFHNQLIDKLNKSGCGISDIEREIHEIRYFIQEYLESFNPVKLKSSK